MESLLFVPTDLVAVEGSLEEETELLRQSILECRVLSQSADGAKGDVVDVALETGERERHMIISQYLTVQLEQNKVALRRLQQGKYGVCEKCGCTIDPARLKVLPSATLCVDCKRLTEC